MLRPSSLPKIAFLDEATSHIDEETEKRLVETYAKVFNDCTVVAITHRLETIRDFDRFVKLDEGLAHEVSKEGILQSPIKKNGSFYEI